MGLVYKGKLYVLANTGLVSKDKLYFSKHSVLLTNINGAIMNELMVLGTVILSLLGIMLAVFLTIVGLLFLSEKFLENNFRE